MAAMELAAFYPQIKQAHIGLVTLSGTLFVLRGAAVLAGQAWPMARTLRVASMLIDTALLTAGATLWAVLSLNPVRDGWLGLKLLLVVAYIVVGTFALKRAPTRAAKATCYAAALALLALVVGIALAHHPAGWFHMR